LKVADIAIIGGGPAGISAAIQLKRSGCFPVLIEGRKLGGLLYNAFLVENYPGFPGGISGGELASRMKKQFLEHKIEFQRKTVKKLAFKDNLFRILLNDKTIKANTVIIASGTIPSPLETSHVHLQPGCHIYREIGELIDIRESKIVIVGSGDSAFDYALNLSSGNNRVVILARGAGSRSLKTLRDRVDRNRSIKIIKNAQVVNVSKGKDRTIVEYNCDSEKRVTEVDHILFAIGRKANLDFVSFPEITLFKDLLDRKRLYLVGDVKNGSFRQVSISVGDGIKAAMEIMAAVTGIL
jgi:thioredoxin reductase